jgi:hypothetical protein
VAKGLALAGIIEGLLAALSGAVGDTAGWVVIGLEAVAGLVLVIGALVQARRARAA